MHRTCFLPITILPFVAALLACSDASPSASCGNDDVEDGEQCDDGNTKSGDGCSKSCRREADAGTDDDDDNDAGDDDDNDAGDDDDGCEVVEVLGCGDVVTADTTSSSSRLDEYGCEEWEQGGPEHIYGFAIDTDADTTVSISLTDLGADLDVIVLAYDGETCGGTCLDQGDNDALFIAEPEKRYLVVVDGFEDSAGGYTLQVECAEETDAFCGFAEESTTMAPEATNLVTNWCSASAGDQTGPEVVYRYEPRESGPVTVDLVPAAGLDLDLMVVEDVGNGCVPSTCLVSSGNGAGAAERVTFSALVDHSYCVIVEGWNGMAGAYAIDFGCE